MTTETKVFSIGGLQINIHGLSSLSQLTPVTILFLLHGRLHDSSMFFPAITAFNLPALNCQNNLQRQLYPLHRLWLTIDWYVLSTSETMDIDKLSIRRSTLLWGGRADKVWHGRRIMKRTLKICTLSSQEQHTMYPCWSITYRAISFRMKRGTSTGEWWE